ncbi:cupin domain-containing protein [Roseiarcaceae bacterium H3SJ34-1]|uniref:cupin domain-containing protein n=1 Tax=Terripilifer ovatus TaxID=3032367 RepID=UPI003AB966ED|nr:cupin domain-containing protein [Roseiarcaceae bacterium H3SJ34-1]
MTSLSIDDPAYACARDEWRRANLAPLWESPTAHKVAGDGEKPLVWAWSKMRPLIGHALAMSSPAAVERRVLSLSNPRLGEHGATLGTLAVALQSLLPGEVARPHRHSMNAIRLVLEGSGAETLVDGKACLMDFGDLILTPGWCWHEHRHPGSEPVIWLDALDVPFHDFLGTSEFQPGPINAPMQTLADDVFAVANMLPDGLPANPQHSPVFRYPFENARRALAAAPTAADGLRRVRYVNPQNGAGALAFLDCSLIGIDRAVAAKRFRSNTHVVCCVLEGEGSSIIGGETVTWNARDIFTVPPGAWCQHRASSAEAKLFVISDRDIFQRLNLLREEIDPA